LATAFTLMLWCVLQQDKYCAVRAMGRAFRTGALALAAAFATTTTGALADQTCARPEEMTAIQAASVQQQLMVSALTCNQISNFNAFQISYGPELRAADATLLRMFKRFYGSSRGEAEYHAFKTRVANDSEMRSINNNPAYCQAAQAVFASALAPNKPSLAEFVSAVQIQEASPFDSCQIRVAVGVQGGLTPASEVVVPRPKPELGETVPAQGASLPGGN